MKRTDGFDARRLRPRQQRSWGARLAAALGLLLIIVGVFLTGSGAASLFSNHEIVVSMALAREAAVTLLVTGLILLLLGAVPSWPHSRGWGYGPSGILGVVLIIVIVLLLMGRI